MFQIVELLLDLQFLQSSEGRLYCEAGSGVVDPALAAPVLCRNHSAKSPQLVSSLGFATEEQGYLMYWLISIFITIFLRGPVP